ncbi:MAG: AAA family ATPase [Candidatus Anstonellales archaeon]
MDENDFTRLLSYSEKVCREKAVDVLRPASQELEESIKKQKIISAIKGLRGVGKSSLLIHILKKYEKAMYINAEFLLKHGYDLYETLSYAYTQGFTTFGIDEIQVIKEWPKDIKLFYDESRTKIIITGSSAIDIAARSSDLARRICISELRPFSFREYIYFKTKTLLRKRTIKELIEERVEVSREVAPFISLYPEFVNHYGLPAAFFEGKDVYPGIIERVVYHDLLSLKSIDTGYIDSAFRLLKFIASSKPGEISYNSVANSIGRSVKFTIELMRLLSISGLITLLPPHGSGHKSILGESKVMLPLSIRNSLGEYFGVSIEKGALREDFFIHHVGHAQYIRETGKKVPDYYVDGYIFEIGGRSKSASQLSGSGWSFIVKESLSVASDEIPLYIFGLLF